MWVFRVELWCFWFPFTMYFYNQCRRNFFENLLCQLSWFFNHGNVTLFLYIITSLNTWHETCALLGCGTASMTTQDRTCTSYCLSLACSNIIRPHHAVDLVTVLKAILTGRQPCEKLHCLYENQMPNNFPKMTVLKKILWIVNSQGF